MYPGDNHGHTYPGDTRANISRLLAYVSRLIRKSAGDRPQNLMDLCVCVSKECPSHLLSLPPRHSKRKIKKTCSCSHRKTRKSRRCTKKFSYHLGVKFCCSRKLKGRGIVFFDYMLSNILGRFALLWALRSSLIQRFLLASAA
jgi:hypothetical protein